MDVMVVAAVRPPRSRWRSGSAGYRAQASANCCTDASTTSATGNRADHSPGAGAEQTTPERALGGIIGVRGSHHSIDQSRSDHTGDGRLPFHSLHLYASWS
jgi:hypothetical protein